MFWRELAVHSPSRVTRQRLLRRSNLLGITLPFFPVFPSFAPCNIYLTTMPSSRKRRQAKERKGRKSSAVAAQPSTSEGGNIAAMLSQVTDRQCLHGFSLGLPDGHPVQAFLSTFSGKVDEKELRRFRQSFDKYSDIWKDERNRTLARDYLICVATDSILKYEGDAGVKIASIAIEYAQFFEQDENDFEAVLVKSLATLRDLRYGGDREVIRFLVKRTSCDCLKTRYSQAKKEQPKKSGQCDHCKRMLDRESLMLCKRCGVAQYCGKNCQRNDWNQHKKLCDATKILVD